MLGLFSFSQALAGDASAMADRWADDAQREVLTKLDDGRFGAHLMVKS